MRHKKTRDIVIELTSLLDIVMILIFAVMIQNTKVNNQQIIDAFAENETLQEELQEKTQALEGISEELQNALAMLEEGEVESLLQRLQNAESKLEAYDYMNEMVIVYNIYLENRTNHLRCLTYGLASEEKGTTITASKKSVEEWNKVKNNFSVDLNNFLKNELNNAVDDKSIYIVFSADFSKIYQNDYRDINKIIEEAINNFEMDHVINVIQLSTSDPFGQFQECHFYFAEKL